MIKSRQSPKARATGKFPPPKDLLRAVLQAGTVKDVAAVYGVTPQAVLQAVAAANLNPALTPWTDEEDLLLEEWWRAGLDNGEIAERLGRVVGAVKVRRSVLGFVNEARSQALRSGVDEPRQIAPWPWPENAIVFTDVTDRDRWHIRKAFGFPVSGKWSTPSAADTMSTTGSSLQMMGEEETYDVDLPKPVRREPRAADREKRILKMLRKHSPKSRVDTSHRRGKGI